MNRFSKVTGIPMLSEPDRDMEKLGGDHKGLSVICVQKVPLRKVRKENVAGAGGCGGRRIDSSDADGAT
jgi:hypothetical protein